MKTDAAKDLIDWFDERIAQAERMANIHACEYARDDDPKAKASFQRQAELHKTYSETRNKVCTTLHILERQIPDAGGAQ